MKRRPTSFIENFDSTRGWTHNDDEENDNQKENENEFDAFSRTSLDDNDFNDYPYDSHVYDKIHSDTMTTATTATTLGTKKSKKMKMWCPNLSMFGFIMKSRKKL